LNKLPLILLASSSLLHAAEPLTEGVAISTSIYDVNSVNSPVHFVDNEFDPAWLESLPEVTAPPARVSLPKVVAQSGQWKGSQSGLIHPTHVVFRQPGLWAKFWTLAIKPYSPGLQQVPRIDFEKDMVVGVFCGEQPDPSYLIKIDSIQVGKVGEESALVVRYRNIQKMHAVFNPPFTVQPFHLIKTRAFNGHVVFVNSDLAG
jgi:hypothetical protein